MTGIGAGTDSFYEYLLKSYVLFGEDEYLDMYEEAQDAIKRNLLHNSKYFYKHVHLHDGTLMATWVDSLSAFMPGVQVCFIQDVGCPSRIILTFSPFHSPTGSRWRLGERNQKPPVLLQYLAQVPGNS